MVENSQWGWAAVKTGSKTCEEVEEAFGRQQQAR
jgi:hypothetical protein